MHEQGPPSFDVKARKGGGTVDHELNVQFVLRKGAGKRVRAHHP